MKVLKEWRKLPKSTKRAVCLGGAFLAASYGSIRPLPYDHRYDPVINSSLRATLIAFEPKLDLGEIEEKIRHTNVGGFSISSRMTTRSRGVTQAPRIPFLSSIQLRTFGPGLIAHEGVHFYHYGKNGFFLSTIFSCYVDGLRKENPIPFGGKQFNRELDEKVGFKGPPKIEKIELKTRPNWKFWQAVVSSGKKKVVIRRIAKTQGINAFQSLNVHPDLQEFTNEQGYADKQAIVTTYANTIMKSIDRVDQAAMDETMEDHSYEIEDGEFAITNHLLDLEHLFQRPGLGTTILRYWTGGMSLLDAEVSALKGTPADRLRERKVYDEIMNAHSLFKLASKRR
ncbi:MAG TPA: hypothetical protein VI875_05350 [Candidatus Norongarragalinales archaeon]|nr:hypothetical protein [Candidatus Norongarragalinales archaeon]